MAVAGPSHYIDLTLDDDFLSGKRGPARMSRSYNNDVIEIFDDSESELSDVEVLDEDRDYRKATSTSLKHARNKASYSSDDEILIVTTRTGAVVPSLSSKLRGLSREASISEDEAFARRLAQEYEGLEQRGSGSGGPSAEDLDADEELARRLTEEDRPVHLSQDERLARRLAEEYDAELSSLPVSPEDEELARQLAEQEEEIFNDLLKTIEGKEEGIVFSVVVNAADETLEDGSPAHPDDLERFRPWKEVFERSGTKVKRFHWVVNYELEKRFERAREKLQEIMGGPSEELQLFHGTNSQNIESILKGGFRIGGVGGQPIMNGAALGCGIYLASDPATSIGYAVGGNKIFACRVVPGRISKQSIPAPPRSIEVGTEQYECYSNGSVYVHRYTSLVLPCYMIEFDVPYKTLGAIFAGPFGIGNRGGLAGGAGRIRQTAMPQPAPVLMPFPMPLKPLLGLVRAMPPPQNRKRTHTVPAETGAIIPAVPRNKRRKLRNQSKNEAGDDHAEQAPNSKGKGKARQY